MHIPIVIKLPILKLLTLPIDSLNIPHNKDPIK